MSSPWDDQQKPNEKSKLHGKTDKNHGIEHGAGAKVPPGLEDKKAEDPNADEVVPEAGASMAPADAPPEDALPLARGYPASKTIPFLPPVTNQHDTPMCVAYSSAYDQNQQDRPETGR